MKLTNKQLTSLLPYVVLLVVALILPLFVHASYWIGIFISVLYKVIATVSLRTISLSGKLTFAHGSFIALGAYCAGVLAKNLGIHPLITILLGGLFAALVSVITGLPFVRLKGLYYSMASMFLGVTIICIIKALKITGGYRGLAGVPALFKNGVHSYYFFILLTVVCLAILYRFEFSRIGTTLRALAQSDDVAASIGINPTFYRLLAVGVGSFFGGIAGASYAHYATILSTTNYDMLFSLWLLMYMMIGGENKFIGPIIGTIIFVLIPEFGRGVSEYAPYITAACTIVVAYLLPGGLAGIPDVIRRRKASQLQNVAQADRGEAQQ
ncbi:MAG: branched-chain amino acid ABC transporter permease [Oscillospiraceae bacterium]|nr:branched-chain amino acid ABC transporter permease [Oscillospiraceae bacterium]